MPRLPDQFDLPRAQPRAIGNVTPISDGGFFQAAGNALGAAQQVAQAQIEYDSKSRFASAESRYLIGQQELIASLDDSDYDTYEKRYEEGMKAVAKKASEIIKSPRDLQAFNLHSATLYSKGQLDIRERYKRAETDAMRAELDTNLAGLRNGAVASSNPSTNIEAINFRIDSAVEDGHISREDGAVMKRKMAVDIATSRAEMLPPAAREAALSNPDAVFSLIPPEVRAVMIEKAKIERITDASRERELLRQEQDDLFERTWASIDSTNGDISSIPSSEIAKLRPSQITALREYAQQRANGYAPQTDYSLHAELSQMAADPRRRQEFNDFDIVGNRHRLAEGDYKNWIQAQAESKGGIVKNTVLDRVVAETTILNTALDKMKIPRSGKDAMGRPAERRDMFTQYVEQKKAARLNELGVENLPVEEFRKIVDAATVDVITNPGTWWLPYFGADTKAKAFELRGMDPEDLDELVVPDDDKRQIEEALSVKGIEATPETVRRYYILMQTQ
jgi:hypothetical protein